MSQNSSDLQQASKKSLEDVQIIQGELPISVGILNISLTLLTLTVLNMEIYNDELHDLFVTTL